MRKTGLVLVLCSFLTLQTGCSTIAAGQNTAFRNETGKTIEALWVDESDDLLIYGPLHSGEAVSVDFVCESDCDHSVAFFTESGEMFRLDHVFILPGQVVALTLSEEIPK